MIEIVAYNFLWVSQSSLCLFPGRGPRPVISILQLTTWNPYTTPHHPNTRQKGPLGLSIGLTRGLLWRLKTVVCVSARPKSTSGIGHLRNLPLHSCAFGVGSFGESKSLWNEKHEILKWPYLLYYPGASDMSLYVHAYKKNQVRNQEFIITQSSKIKIVCRRGLSIGSLKGN